VSPRRLTDAPPVAQGYYEARPGDVAGRSHLVLVDVREESELLEELGHIHGVRHVPLAKLATSLVARGFVEVYSVSGGMIRWNAEERPVARTRTWT